MLDALKLTPFYNAFEISANVPEIYMQEFWVTVTKHHSSLRLKMNDKSHTMNVDNFRDMLKICPKLPSQKFEELQLEKDILSFIRDLGHTGEIKFLSNVNEDLVFQVENKNSKKNNDMYYPRFTKVIVDYFMAKDHAIPRRNKLFWHDSRDDFMFTTHLTNQAMLESEAYITYRAYETGEKTPKPKTIRKKADLESSPKINPTQASKGKRIKTPAKGDKATKKKQPAKSSKTKGLTKLSDVALTEAEQLKLATKRSRIQTHSSHASGSGADEGTGEDDEENDEHDSANDNDDEDADEVNDSDDDNYENDNDDEDDDQVHDSKETKSKDEGDDFVHPNLSTYKADDEEEEKEEEKAEMLMNFERRVSALEIELSELKQTNQFGEALSSILGIVDKYLSNKMKETVDVAVQLKSNKLREEAQAENQDFLNSLDSNMRKIIKEQVKAQTSKIMSKVKKYVTKTLGAEVLVRSTNQSQTSYAVASTFSELELKKILIDKMEENKSIDRSKLQKNLYNALVKSYNSDKDLLSSYGDVVTIPRGHDDEDKDEEPSARSNRGTKRRRSGKEAESSKEPTHK
ncbi:hypothetical protein Tco_0896414 [Tanacetum coccineum]